MKRNTGGKNRNIFRRELMRFFYKFLLAWTRLDLKIAQAVSNNNQHIEQLQREKSNWEHELLLLDINNL